MLIVGSEARPTVFLDRDGTLNVEVNYLHRIADLVLIPGAAAAIKRLNQAHYYVVVVTNQAGIARGYYDEAALHQLHEHLLSVLAAEGATIDAFYFCPHHPDFTGPCACRKPGTGMLLQAVQDLNIDLAHSWLVGDTASDLAAGREVGCRTVLVRTGYGRKTERDLVADEPHPIAIVDDIGAAIDFILNTASDD